MAYPIYIPSKGRPHIAGTARLFDRLGKRDYTLIVEQPEYDDYAAVYGKERVAVLPREFQTGYDPLDGYGGRFPLGSGPARNYGWHLAREAGAEWHWIIDDNLQGLFRYGAGGFTIVKDGPQYFEDAERYITQYRNVGMGGPIADAFISHRHGTYKRAVKNSRIYSFNLIRTAAPFKWRGRYNEDTILSLDFLTNRWATLLLYFLVMKKPQTQKIRGGNTDQLYARGTGPKSRLLARVYPKYVSVVYRYSRIHHFIDYRKHFADIPLLLERKPQ